MRGRNLAVAVASCTPTNVDGLFYRHTWHGAAGLTPGFNGGRWAAPNRFGVLYLGRPPDSVTAEAYRHLVDDDPNLTGDMVGPRNFFTMRVSATEILDLRIPENRETVDLTTDDLASEVHAYARCNRVGHAVFQLGWHGVIAPAATGLGETLALFEQHLPPDELPVIEKSETWTHLPADPRHSGSRDSK